MKAVDTNVTNESRSKVPSNILETNFDVTDSGEQIQRRMNCEKEKYPGKFEEINFAISGSRRWI